jgi:hypothetical protein
VDHVVEDEVEAAGHAGGDEPVELDDIGVVEAAQDEDLARHEPHALGLQVVEAHLLERHDLAAKRVSRLVHIAVRALADLSERERTRGRRKKRCNFFHLGARAARITELGRRMKGRTLSIFSKESARRGVHPSMASPATAESQAGQPAATCSPRALLAKLPPRRTSVCAAKAAERDDRDRRSRLTFWGFSAACCSGASASTGGAAAAESTPSLCVWEAVGWSRRLEEVAAGAGLEVAGRPCTQPMAGRGGAGHPRRGMGRAGPSRARKASLQGRREAAIRRRRRRVETGGAGGKRKAGLEVVVVGASKVVKLGRVRERHGHGAGGQ